MSHWLSLLAACNPPLVAPIEDSDVPGEPWCDEIVDTPVCPPAAGGLSDCLDASGVTRIEPDLGVLDVFHINSVAVGDFTGDGLPDALSQELTGPARLYANCGGFRFQDVTERAGIDVVGPGGAAFGDLDADGRQDLVITGSALDVIAQDSTRRDIQWVRVYHNEGDRFAEVTDAWGFGEVQFASPTALRGVDLVDVTWDGRLDVIARPLGVESADGRLLVWVSGPDGTWTEDALGTIGNWQGNSYGTLPADLDDDGWPDLVAIFMRGGTFAPPSRLLRRTRAWPAAWEELDALPDDFGNTAGSSDHMAVVAADVDGDGLLDLVVSDKGPQHVFRRRSGVWEDGADALGAAAATNPEGERTVGFAVAAVDLDGNGRPDLAITSGRDGADRQAPYPVLLLEEGGQFTDRSDLLGGASRDQQAVVAADFDADGHVDLWFGGVAEPPRLLRNELGGEPLTSVRLRGTVSNPDGVGAVVTVEGGGERRVGLIYGGGNAFGSAENRLWFAGAIDRVEVRWPSGLVQVVDAPVGRDVQIEEPRVVEVERAVLAAGDTLRVTIRPVSPEGAPRDAEVTATLLPGGEALDVQRLSEGTFEATMPLDVAGRYAVEVAFDGAALTAFSEVVVR